MKIKYLFRVFFLVFGVVPLLWSFLYYASHHPSRFLRFMGESEIYSKDLALFKLGGSVCLYDRARQTRTSPWVHLIFRPLNQDDSLTVFIDNNGKRGYLNLLSGGTVEITARFESAWQFSEGLAAVVENRQLGFINLKGEYAFKTKAVYNRLTMSDLDFLFNQGSCLFPGKNGAKGLINNKGEVVVEPVFAYISDPEEGLRIVSTYSGKEGVVDSSFRFLVDTLFDRVEVVLNHGIVVTKESEQQLLDFHGQPLHFVYDAVFPLYMTDVSLLSGEDIIAMETGFSAYSHNGRLGLFDDRNKKRITPPLWNNITYHAPGIFAAHLGGFCVLLDEQGQQIVAN